MNELFGIPMTGIAIGCMIIAAAIFLFVGVIALRNPVMFKTGLRNIPRRPAQTALIVVGLMLSTLIITAAFGTGDTLTRSVTADVYRQLDEADQMIIWDTDRQAAGRDEQVIPAELVERLRQDFAADPDIEAFIPMLHEPLPIFNTRTRLNDPTATVSGYDLVHAEPFGGLVDLDGNPVSLTGNQIAVNEDLADEIDAVVGDVLIGFFEDQQVELEVVAIIPTNVFGGIAPPPGPETGGTVSRELLADLTGKQDVYDVVYVSHTGDAREGLALTDDVKERLDAYLEGTPYVSEPIKQDLIELAELFGNIFTTFFVVLGLFSIAAGVLLIFLIFIMLAAERKPEMGMARAVGAKRFQIVQSFLAEGMGYDLGSAVIGLFAGMGVTFLMVAIVTAFGGEALGLDLTVTFTWRGLITAFSLGIIATFIVIFIASWRASRLNIVAAIRDIPESRPINPEQATWYGFLRALLNAFAAVGFFLVSFLITLRIPALAPIALLGMFLGLVGPFLYVLRGSNFAAPRHDRVEGEGIPVWPFFTVLGIPFYLAALLLVRITRDRKPRSMPGWMLVVGILVMPVGLVLAALQDRKAGISWAIGLATMGAILGVFLIEWGMDVGRYFQFTIGFTLVMVWFAVLMRYFQIQERLAFTVTGLVLLVFWYLPSEVLEIVLPEMTGDIEMFFVSGVAVITAATFVVIYNADLFLPVVARLGSRFGRIVPAIKTGVAYPLTSRFRTGMTMAMIGLIMFSLVMMTSLNTNFANIFLSDDTKGGFDVQVATNPNNRIQDMRAAVQQAGLDPNTVTGAGEVRVAYDFEAEVSNIHGYGDPGPDGQPQPYLRYTLMGVDQGFVEANDIPIRFRADGYSSDEEIWAALREDPTLALVPPQLTSPPEGFGGPPQAEDQLRLDRLRDGFEPFELEIRNPGNGESRTITVIGQMADAPSLVWFGIMFGRDTLLEVYPQATGQLYYLTLDEGVDSRDFARDLEAGLLTASVDSLDQMLEDQQSLQRGFFLVFQGFMGLGLIVGIAALGVVASRSVIERRQQIGMLRAIGYQRGMVALSFIFESAFIALSGILMGLILGLVLAWLLFTTGEIGEEAEGFAFIVPWVELAIISGIAFGASLLMTFLPARSASRVAVADALRYE